MWFLNKETGLTWEITDTELIQRLEKNDYYEAIKKKKKVAEVKNAKSQNKE